MDRLYGVVICVLVIAAVISPALRDPEDDDFPLSTYPMFARPRRASTTIQSAVAVAADGSQVPVPPALVGTHETMQAVRILSRSLRDGPEATQQLCQAIAARVARSGGAMFAAAREVAIVSQEVDAIGFARGEGASGATRTHASCAVPRGRAL